MLAPEPTPDETERLADLHDYALLDSGPEAVFDEIVRLAASICGTEFAAISLIDRDRQWFKAEHGLNMAETPREHSICAHAIHEERFFEIPDTRADERFVGNPLLENAPGIRFYGGSRLTSANGRALGMLCVLDSKPQQLTEPQRQALHHLSRVVMALFETHRERQAVEWFGRVVDTLADEIFIVDEQSLRLVYANAVAQRNLGCSMSELRRMTPLQAMPELGWAEFEKVVAQLRAGASQAACEGMRQRRDAACFPAEIRVQRVTTRGRPVLVLLVHDISERKEMDRIKDEFVAVVNHELRTPLTSIHGAVRLLEQGAGGPLPAPAQQLVNLAAMNTDRLRRIVDDILDLEKIGSGRMHFDLQRLDAGAAIEQAARAHEAAARLARVHLVVAPPPEPLSIHADAGRLQQVLANLVSNAIKFAPPGSAIELQAKANAGRIQLGITDRGPGVPENFRSRIFERFAQADMQSTREKGGSGLGLSIVKKMTEQMGGQVDYDSEPGRTTFRISFPGESQ